MRTVVAVIFLAAAAPAVAAGSGNFDCVPIAEASALLVEAGGIKINNVVVGTKLDPIFNIEGLEVFEVTYSARNSGSRPYHVSGQFVVLGPSGELLAAIEASPSADFLAPGRSVQVSGEVYVVPGSTGSAASVCYDFVGKSSPALPG